MIQTTLHFQRTNRKQTRLKAKYVFNVTHNLDEFSLDIEAALINWVPRTNEVNVESFCAYVISKDTINLKCTPTKTATHDT